MGKSLQRARDANSNSVRDRLKFSLCIVNCIRLSDEFARDIEHSDPGGIRIAAIVVVCPVIAQSHWVTVGGSIGVIRAFT